MTSNMINWRKVQEEMYHNREMERLTGEQQAEIARHDVATEYETQRSNKANESIKRQQNAINLMHYTMSDIFGTVLPELRGKSASQAALNYASAEEAKSKGRAQEQEANLSAAKTFLTYAQTEQAKAQTNYIKSQIALAKADTLLKDAQTNKTKAETTNVESKTDLNRQSLNYNTWNNPAKTINNYISVLSNLINLGSSHKLKPLDIGPNPGQTLTNPLLIR